MNKSRAYTREEMQEQFLDTLDMYISYWDRLEGKTKREALEGLAFSFLNMLDGTTMGLPAFELYPAPHESDKQYHIDNDEMWYDKEITLHGYEMLHDTWAARFRKKTK